MQERSRTTLQQARVTDLGEEKHAGLWSNRHLKMSSSPPTGRDKTGTKLSRLPEIGPLLPEAGMIPRLTALLGRQWLTGYNAAARTGA